MSPTENPDLAHVLARLDEAERRGQAAERRALRAERRSRARALFGGGALVLALALGSAPQAAARQLGVTLASLAAQVAQLRSDLNAETNARSSVDNDLQSAVASLGSRAAALETKTHYQSVSGTSTIFSGTNVFVQSGSGNTNGAVNGLGNLIVGYGENTYSYPRTGSHNLVVGMEHGYSSYGGVVFGNRNQITGVEASILGGFQNLAAGSQGVVLGGQGNAANGDFSTVSGGGGNTASALYSSVAGGLSNTASGQLSAVGGGNSNVETRRYGWKASAGLTN